MVNEAEQRFKSLGTVSKRFTIPILFWEEWEKDCADRFGGTYASKMQHDHEFHKSMAAMTQLVAQDMVLLQEKVMELTLELESIREELLSNEGKHSDEDIKSSNTEPEVATKGSKTF